MARSARAWLGLSASAATLTVSGNIEAHESVLRFKGGGHCFTIAGENHYQPSSTISLARSCIRSSSRSSNS
jgi:hypothetical protein